MSYAEVSHCLFTIEHLKHRVLDVVVSVMACVALLPLLALTTLAIRLESPGAVIIRQARAGRDGKLFQLLTFRSTYVDAEARRDEVLAELDNKGINLASRKDPGITRVGRFIRRCSIDELPQIINVLRGDMAIFGPRPALPVGVAAFSRRTSGRVPAKPGVTGK